MKTSSIKNTIIELMLFLGVAIQFIAPTLANINHDELQTRNQKFANQLKLQFSKIELPSGISQVLTQTRVEDGEL